MVRTGLLAALVLGFQGAARVYRFVKAGQIKKSAETILATE